MSITINPMKTTNAAGSFNISSTGFIQGNAMADPATRFALRGGVLAADETLPMWGGVGIYEYVPGSPSAANALGGNVGRALLLTGPKALTGFSVFDQNHSMVNSPQSPVPLSAVGMGVNLYALGSNARIAVACDPVLIDLDGGLITQQVSWDFSLQRLIPYAASYPANVITAATWSAGIVTLTTTTAHTVAVGDDFTIAGMTPDGYNGTFTATAGTAGSTLKYALAADPGSETVLGTLVAGGGALPCKILNVQAGNSMTVVFDPATGFATWNRSGSAALIQI